MGLLDDKVISVFKTISNNEKRFVNWAYEERNGKTTKVPKCPITRGNASSTDQKTWVSLDTAIDFSDRYDGIGIVLGRRGDGCIIVLIDIDNCIKEDGTESTIVSTADEIFGEKAYIEVSPSGKGIHVIAILKELPPPETPHKLPIGESAVVECYWVYRYSTISGNFRRIGSMEPADEEFAEFIFHARLKNVVAVAFSLFGEKFKQLYNGEEEGYPSASEGDLAFLSMLARVTQDENFVRGVIKNSMRNRDKWWERDEYYFRRTWSKVLDGLAKHDSAPRESKSVKKDRLVALYKILCEREENGEIELWRDQTNTVYITTETGESVPLRSERGKGYLIRLYYELFEEVLGAVSLGNLIGLLVSRAMERPTQFAFLRVGKYEGEIFYDLANDAREVVRITPSGWEITTDCPIKFLRTSVTKPQVIPRRGGADWDEFFELYEVESEVSQTLCRAFILQATKHAGPFAHMIITGPQGCGKSELVKGIKRVMDPTLTELQLLPDGDYRREFMRISKLERVLAFDNVSRISNTLSDTLCTMSTGVTTTVRQLYTTLDSEASVMEAPVIVNGITADPMRGDLLERAILYDKEILQRKLTTEELYEDFEAILPGVMAAVFDDTVRALKNYTNIELKYELPRMADFCCWAVAATGDEDIPLYIKEELALANDSALEATFFGQILVEFLDDFKYDETYDIPVKQLYEILWSLAKNARESRASPRQLSEFPPSPWHMARAITRVAPMLASRGWLVKRGRVARERRYRFVKI
jgi:energy-coupling factor transporter ATP-binding protein EcfA2